MKTRFIHSIMLSLLTLIASKEIFAVDEKPAPTVTASQDGFLLKAPDKSFQIRLKGYLQTDGRFFSGDEVPGAVDTFVLRRARTIVEGTVFEYFDFNLSPDFGGGTAVLKDAYLEAKFAPWFKLRAGKFKVPLGLERLQSSASTLFTETALPTQLTPDFDVGVQIHGEGFEGVLNYALGVFNGVADGASSDADTDKNKHVAGRIWLQPFKMGGNDGLKNFGLGVAGTQGKPEGTTVSAYKSAGQNSFFAYGAGTVENGTHTRFSPQASYYFGPFGLFAEYVSSKLDLLRVTPANPLVLGSVSSTSSGSVENKAWQASASYVLTGEDASYKGVSPKINFDPEAGTYGAFEIAARYGELDVDDAVFSKKLASISTAANKAKEWAVGLNWYWNKNVKWVLDYSQTDFSGGAVLGQDRPTEQAILTRLQLSY